MSGRPGANGPANPDGPATPDLLLGIDQGTTSTRTIAFDRSFQVVASAARPLETAHPKPGWVEIDADALLSSVVETVAEVLDAVGGIGRVAAVGLANQGETVVAWDATTMRPLAPAIVWQCRRSGPIVDRQRAAGHEPVNRSMTGLPLDPYFSAGKMTWLLEEDAAVRGAMARGTLRFGTVDAWLTASLELHRPAGVTDVSTASRTQLFALEALDWDARLLDLFGVGSGTLPTVGPTAGRLGALRHPSWGGALPLTAMACDQQAALAGHGAFEPGTIKATYGTGVFVLANAGPRRTPVEGLETSIAWSLPGGRVDAVLQGGVFTAGAMIDWLRDGLGLIADPAETEALARSVPDTAGVMVVPALAGLGAPWYRPDATASIVGLTAAAGRAHVVRAVLDGIAQRVADVVETMSAALDAPASSLRVDGGLTRNGYLMERQADLLGMPVAVASLDETTALGVAGLAAIGAGLATEAEIAAANPVVRTIGPHASAGERTAGRAAWRAIVERLSG
jgi:glycerol kinase